MPNYDEDDTIVCQQCGGRVRKEDCPHNVTKADKINTGDDLYDQQILIGYPDDEFLVRN